MTFMQWAHDAAHFVQTHPEHAAAWTFFMAWLESLAVVGSIVPGSVTMTAIGALAGVGSVGLISTYLWAILGALAGDYLSYWIGWVGRERIRTWSEGRFWYPWLIKGEALMRDHGIKSVIIGRFFGPLRSLTPTVAGALHLPPWRFTLAVIPAAILWSLVYLTPGVWLGRLASVVPKHTVLHLIEVSVAALLIASLLRGLNRWMRKRLPFNPAQNTHLSLALTASLVFAALAIAVSPHHPVGNQAWVPHADQILYDLSQSLHRSAAHALFLAITFAGSKSVVIPAFMITGGWLLLRGQVHEVKHWALHGLGSALVIKAFKLMMSRHRPPLVDPIMGHFSFPSGHTAITAALVLYVAYRLGSRQPHYRLAYWTAAVIWIALVGLSRVYCGAHWTSDVLAGAALGCACVHISLMWQRRPLVEWGVGGVFITSLIPLWMLFGLMHMSQRTALFFSSSQAPTLQAVGQELSRWI